MDIKKHEFSTYLWFAGMSIDNIYSGDWVEECHKKRYFFCNVILHKPQTSYGFQCQFLRIYWNVWETLPPAATDSIQVSSLKLREWAEPCLRIADRKVSVRSSVIYYHVTRFGWVCPSDRIWCLIIWLSDFLFSELSLWNRVCLDWRFKGSGWQRSTKKDKKRSDWASPSVVTQLWHEHVSPDAMLRSLGSVVFGSVGTWGA